MEFIYVCCPYDGLEENYFKALNYCQYVINKGKAPLCTATMYHKIYNEQIPKERTAVKEVCQELLKLCTEVWIFGRNKSTDISVMSGAGKPIRYIKDSFSFNSRSEMLSVILREFETRTGRPVNGGIMENIVFYLDEGMSDKLIIAAIKKAALKSAGWDYAEGILKNCLNRGVTTAEEMERSGKPVKSEENYAAYDLDLYENMINSKNYGP